MRRLMSVVTWEQISFRSNLRFDYYWSYIHTYAFVCQKLLAYVGSNCYTTKYQTAEFFRPMMAHAEAFDT